MTDWNFLRGKAVGLCEWDYPKVVFYYYFCRIFVEFSELDNGEKIQKITIIEGEADPFRNNFIDDNCWYFFKTEWFDENDIDIADFTRDDFVMLKLNFESFGGC